MKLIKKAHIFFNKKDKTRGQGMLEFALVIPIFLLLVFGIFEFGRLFAAIITVNTASREAARYGAGIGMSGAGMPFYQDCAGMESAGNAFSLFAESISVDIRYDTGPEDPRDWESLPVCGSLSTVALSDRVIVHIQGEYRPIILFNDLVIPVGSKTSRTLITKLDIQSTQYAVVMPTIESTPVPTEGPTPVPTLGPTPVNTAVPTVDPNHCNNISISNVSISGEVFSFDILNSNESYHAVFDEIWFYLSGTSSKKYFDHLRLIDSGEMPEVEMTNLYFDVNAEPYRFVFSPRTLGPDGSPLMYDDAMVGVKPNDSTRVEFDFTNPSVSVSSIVVRFYDTACEKSTTP